MHCEVTVSNVSHKAVLDVTRKDQTLLNHVHEGQMKANSLHTVDNMVGKKPGDSVIVAWASAQIYCQCNSNENKVAVHMNNKLGQEHLATNMDTSFIPSKGISNLNFIFNTAEFILSFLT